MEELFNPTSILLHMLNAAILLVALYFLLYKPVRKFLKKREDAIIGQLDAAAARAESSEALLLERERALSQASAEAAEIIRNGEARGKLAANDELARAHEEARRIIEKARAQAAKIAEDSREELYEQAARHSVEIAQMILTREVNRADHDRLIEEFITEAQGEKHDAAVEG